MWIFLTILAILAAIVTVILLLPVDIIIKSSESGEMLLRYKFLFKTYGENPDPHNPIIKAVKKTTGIERLEIKAIKKNLKDKSYIPTAAETFNILVGLLKEVGRILKHFRAKRLWISVLCATDDAAKAAINYGQYSALIYPLLGAASAFIKIPSRAKRINLGFDPSLKEDAVHYDIVISISVLRVLSAFFRVAFAEAQRNLENEPPKGKNQSR